jgi:Peptidase_C39 like family/Tetratricopeptide repeat
MKPWQKLILAALAVLILGGLSMLLPPVQTRVMSRVDELRLRIFYTLHPPEQAVFQPEEQAAVAAAVHATLTQIVLATTPTPGPTATTTSTPFPPDVPTITPTATLTPPPSSALIDNVPYVDQHYGFNNCAPSNLTMALKFWGWPGTREEVSAYVKPFPKDKNVMPYELADYVNSQTGLRALIRLGGDMNVLKRLIAGGFPAIVERGVFLPDISGKVSWMGHYQVVYGYDDAKSLFQVKDSFEQGGDHFTETYDEMTKGWMSFTNTFLVVYPPEREGDLLALLGPYGDETNAFRIAAQTAAENAVDMTGQNQFFALFNRGSALVKLQDYNGAAEAYDAAFKLYATLPGDQRPWRMVWYQTGPYYAYFNTGRFADVINLADKTINTASEPYIEESWYWRARAKSMTGDTEGAISDLRKSLEYHPNFSPSVALLQQLGATP